MNNKKIYVGLDIGTNSVGYAVTDDQYNILKFRGEPAWGSVVFDQAKLNDERRGYRTARRRLQRRNQRVTLLQDIFAREISKVDEHFFIRLKKSALYGDDVSDKNKNTLFCDGDYTDVDYHRAYPTIHHLIVELMKNSKLHDVRLVYLAIAWLVKHRGHFLSNIDVNDLDSIKDFNKVYAEFMDYFRTRGYCKPWEADYDSSIGDILKEKKGVNYKYSSLREKLYNNSKPQKTVDDDFPYSREGILKLLAGGTYKLSDLFGKEEYAEFASVSLKMDDDKLIEIASNIGEDFELISATRKVYDWAVLVDVLGQYPTISESKVAVYDKHKKDLQKLKYIIRQYKKDKYSEIFRNGEKGKYEQYVSSGKKEVTVEEFSKYLIGILKDIEPSNDDEKLLSGIKEELDARAFLPKQVNIENRVIPYQLYQYELNRILDNATNYLPFLKEVKDGYSNREKIEKIFEFRIPYFVGPLNRSSDFAWMKRFPGADGKIFPWNFEDVVDLDASEQEFIRRMTNKCTYLPGEDVLPKCSLLYQRFVVLNELNNIRINNEKIDVKLKQSLYADLFMKYNRVTKKRVIDYMISNNYISKGDEELVSGIDTNLTGTLSSRRAFDRLISENVLSEKDIERIIERSTFSEDKSRLKKWIIKEFPKISEEDVKYICSIKLKDFGRLSKKLLNGIEAAKKDTGEVYTIISALWNTQDNLSEIILTDKYTFKETISEISREYYEQKKIKLADRLDDMYISNSVRRPIYRTMAILKDIEKAFGVPDKIFVEMARGSDGKSKGKRTSSRLEQIQSLYEKCRDEDVRELNKQLKEMGDTANNNLQSDKLFLYYMQLGKSMYSGKEIKLEDLKSKAYDIDHIYPQSVVTDDSVINNKVLVLSKENGEKADNYPISGDIRKKMSSFWKYLYDCNLVSDTKYKRLIRSIPFSDEERQGFINRQYVETTQATKAVATIIGEKYQDAEIVYCKAKLASEFRQIFDIYKSRSFNDLHHAVDAYLNVVAGNIYNMRFTKKWFNINDKYSVNPKTVFKHDVVVNDSVIWNEELAERVRKQAVKNNAHFVKYSYYKHGGLFDQMPVSKKEGLVPLKKGMDTSKYGGYNKPGVMFYIPVRYRQGKKTAVIVMSVELLFGKRFLEDYDYAREYSFIRLKHILGKPVDEIEFPMGMRPWKVNTMLSLDGYRVCITGIGAGGKCLRAQGVTQFSDSEEWVYYVGKLEKYSDKLKKYNNYSYNEEYDKISKEKNMLLYELYIKKYKESIYSKRINDPLDILKNGYDKFAELSINDQVSVLMNIHSSFCRDSLGGVDLKLIGGSGKSAAMVNFSSTINNWAKNYNDVRIIDMSSSGLWEKQSENLLDLL